MDTQSVPDSSIGEEIKSFATQIDSLRTALPMTMILLQRFAKDAADKLRQFEAESCKLEVEGTRRRVLVPIEHFSKWNRLKHRFDQAQIARRLVPRSLLVSVVSQYDAFLGRLLRSLFLLKPEMLNASKRTIEFADLAKFTSMDDARDFVIAKEVESVLRMSHVEQFKWRENRFALELTKFQNWPKFVEITERRNLFVHADGNVSKQYLTECARSNAQVNAVEGELLAVSKRYYDEACACILEVGVKLAHVLWRKIDPSQLEEADKRLNWLAYEFVDRQEHELAITLLRFAVFDLRKKSDESSSLTFLVNLAQAYRWHGQIDDCNRILDAEDWSAKGEEFRLAEAVLRQEWDRAAHLVKRIGKDGPVSEIDYRDWPLFREFRLTPEFQRAYELAFEKPFPAAIQSESTDPEIRDEGSSTSRNGQEQVANTQSLLLDPNPAKENEGESIGLPGSISRGDKSSPPSAEL